MVALGSGKYPSCNINSKIMHSRASYDRFYSRKVYTATAQRGVSLVGQKNVIFSASFGFHHSPNCEVDLHSHFVLDPLTT